MTRGADVASRWPQHTSFASLPEAQQLELLRAWEGRPFFETLRAAAISGMFSLPEYRGNRGEAGWRLLGFEHRMAWQPPFGAYDAQWDGDGGEGEG